MSNIIKRANASGGIAIADGISLERLQIVVNPSGSPSGTLTLTAKPVGGNGYESIVDADGNALTGLALSAQFTRTLEGGFFEGIRAESTNSGDEFELVIVGNAAPMSGH